MLGSSPLDAIPFGALFLLVLIAILAAADGGYRLGRHRRNRTEDEKEAPVGAMVGATSGLLAFILAITFNVAASRFDARRSLVLQEANSIGTTYLRAGLLPERGPEIQALLREYLEVRLAVARRDVPFDEARRRSEEIQARLWAHATAVATAHPGSVVAGLFVHTLNDTIDIHSMRIAALRARIPLPIWITLTVLSLMAFALMGYSSGLSKTSRSPAAVAMAVCFAMVIVLVVDLDRPFDGWLVTSQQPLIDARQGMNP